LCVSQAQKSLVKDWIWVWLYSKKKSLVLTQHAEQRDERTDLEEDVKGFDWFGAQRTTREPHVGATVACAAKQQAASPRALVVRGRTRQVPGRPRTYPHLSAWYQTREWEA
jgi:hypothetical protein